MENYLVQKTLKNYEKIQRNKNFLSFLYNSEFDKEQYTDRIIL